MFLSALARPRTERAAWVAEECQGDPGLLNEVEQLLRHHDQTVGEAVTLEPGDAEPQIPVSLGDFRILDVVGRGGMGVVYRAQRGSEPPVALKVLRPGLLTPDLLARFGREAEMLSRLDHPGIARLLETGVFDTPGGAQPYFAMVLVEGHDLRRWAAKPHPLTERLELLARVCDAVDHAHGQGIVHRDLKPENILVRADQSPCVLDFGVARLTESDYRATTMLTSAGVLVGTVRYMSPEQADARPGGVDARSDVYSLGVIAHELLSGVMPYDVPKDSLHRAIVAVITAPPRPLPQIPGARGRALEVVLGKALAKAADERYASAAELAAELRRVAAGQRPHARPARRAPRLPRAVPLLVFAVIVAFAAGQWLGGREWFRTASPTLGGRNAPLDRAIALLDSAAARIHFTPTRTEPLREGLAMSDSARSLLGRARERAAALPLQREAWVLAMEAHLRLAELTLEPGEYEACIAAGLEANRLGAAGGAQLLVPSGASALFDHLADLRYQQPKGVMALAASRLGIYSQPRTQQQRALEWNRQALDSLAARPPHADVEGRTDPLMRELARRSLLAERGSMLARAGALADSAAQVREGLRLLQVPVDPVDRDLDPRATVRWHLRNGCAWSALARIEGRPAAFDSAVARLRSSILVGRERSSPVLEAESRLSLAEVLRWRARTRADRELARGDLRAAVEPLDERFDVGPAGLHPRYTSLLRLKRAQVRLDLATLDRSRSEAESVLVALARADSLFTPTTHPVLCSEIEIERARAGALLWTLTGDRFMREAALRRLEGARRLVPADEDPGSARRIEFALGALRAGERRAADLAFPVPAGPVRAAPPHPARGRSAPR